MSQKPPDALTMTDFRKEPGERLRDVHRGGRSFVITKSGKPVALLTPYEPPFDWAALRSLRKAGGY